VRTRVDVRHRFAGYGCILVVLAVVAGWLGATAASGTCFRANKRTGHCQVVPRPVQFRVGYAGVGTETVDGQWPDNAGCLLKATTTSSYAFLEIWSVRATVKGDTLLHVTSKFLRSEYPSGYSAADNTASIKGSKVNKPDGEQCAWSGGSDDRGTFDCQAKPAPLQFIHELTLRRTAAGFGFEAGGMFGHAFQGVTFTGQDTVPSHRASSGGCGAFDLAFDGFWDVPREAEVSKVPVRMSALANLARNHFFRVRTSAGHYAPAAGGPDCLPPVPPKDEGCTVTDHTFRGELLVKRVS
jgi:hypothetical protein